MITIFIIYKEKKSMFLLNLIISEVVLIFLLYKLLLKQT